MRRLALLMSVGVGLMGTFSIAPAEQIRSGPAAFGDWSDDAPGVRRLIKPGDLPAPAAEESVRNSPHKAAKKADAKPKVMEGFNAEVFATGIKSPRVIRFAPNGDMFVADSKADQVRVYRLNESGDKVAASEIYAANLHKTYGIAFYPLKEPKWVYIANSRNVVRFPYKKGDLKAQGEAEVIIDHIPETHHWTRDIVFLSDGKVLYLAVGSGSNVALDMFHEPLEGGLEDWNKTHPVGATWDTEERRANVLAFDPDGKNEKIFATGLRNCSGMTIQPATSKLWCVVNERDEIGDNVPFNMRQR